MIGVSLSEPHMVEMHCTHACVCLLVCLDWTLNINKLIALIAAFVTWWHPQICIVKAWSFQTLKRFAKIECAHTLHRSINSESKELLLAYIISIKETGAKTNHFKLIMHDCLFLASVSYWTDKTGCSHTAKIMAGGRKVISGKNNSWTILDIHRGKLVHKWNFSPCLCSCRRTLHCVVAYLPLVTTGILAAQFGY